jgi:hypothetical protein
LLLADFDGLLQAPPDQLNVRLRRGDAAPRLLLEGVQYEDALGQSNGSRAAPASPHHQHGPRESAAIPFNHPQR